MDKILEEIKEEVENRIVDVNINLSKNDMLIVHFPYRPNRLLDRLDHEMLKFIVKSINDNLSVLHLQYGGIEETKSIYVISENSIPTSEKIWTKFSKKLRKK